ncbi:hypothetical protein P168DRAFT_318949 [Aspergillus campestris IBT 28561]|uniref:Autophagy-related protein 14 n=1 Tax=Aspergillus campestris (strain IBT 28561) TaxID=1392248 RepID=A0A2I1D0T7_ASPC2|nr:uncharacterized protein P168DRAFT_318949 [Aspergillus campestris IBT 28561]PKY03486.1 hypothetical protein P168DRAFT_318949 [Aspergillus campestris IBT 28561]
MSLSGDDPGPDATTRRETPWLLPTNRRLRHLYGLSLRNLVLTPPNPPNRKKTIDDEEIPNALQSPFKRLALDARSAIPQSRSFTNLPTAGVDGDKDKTPAHRPASSPARRPVRRRSTLPGTDLDPRTREGQLQAITRSRMADTWFSLHTEAEAGAGSGDGAAAAPPVYVSEVVENATNPSFRFFDLTRCGPGVARGDWVMVRVWARATPADAYALLVEWQLSLPSLQFLGRSLDGFHHPLPPNSLIFHFPDGVYTSLTDLPPAASAPVASRAEGTALPTASYDALMRLANLDECIQDARTTRARLEAQITAILETHRPAHATTSEAAAARETLALTRQAVAAERKQLRLATRRREALAASLRARRDAMARGRQVQERARSHLPDARAKLAASTALLAQTGTDTRGQLRRIAEDLLAIYPIEPVADQPLAFTIVGLPLPNSDFADVDDRDRLAAALGWTAHLVHLLSLYLSAPVPYPIHPALSQSQIHDPVSVDLAPRRYPLHPGPAPARFDYGVFLLNKDIEFVMNTQGLRGLDRRQTLPNLKYLLYVLTAGPTAIPARKAGGIRGLRLRATHAP